MFRNRPKSGMLACSLLVVFWSLGSCLSSNMVKKSEAVLKQNLYSMRSAIDQYTEDKGRAPQHLTDLVTSGYLHAIPADPFTRSNTTWVEVAEDTLGSVDQNQPGISDVHSGCHNISSEGTRYDTW